ncbi:MAG: glycosyltransferase [Patescibacteria group bacterium]|mgnify:CR=1 FL=1
MKKSKVCILVSNNLKADPRVSRQLETIRQQDFQTLVLAWEIAPQSYLPLTITDQGDQKIYQGRFTMGSSIYIFKNLNLCLAIFNLPFLIKGIAWLLFIYLLYPMKQKVVNYLYPIKQKLVNYLYPIKQKVVGEKQFLNQIQNLPLNSSKKNIKNHRTSKPGTFLDNLGGKLAEYKYLSLYYWKIFNFMTIYGTKFKPKIVYANDLDTLLAGYCIKKKTGAKLVYDAHEIWTEQGLEIPKPFILFFKMIEQILIKRIDAFVTVNQSIIKEISRRYHYQFKVPAVVIYNCPLYQKSRFRPSQKKIKILYQGRYSPYRGLEQTIESFRWLDKKYNFYLRGVGDEMTRIRLQKLVQKFHLSSRVKFLPPVAPDQLVKEARFADIGVVSYLPVNINNRLCTPNKIFEYMMAGLVLACSDLPELRKIVKKYQNGVLFNPDNPQSIAQALNLLAKDPRRLNQMKKNSLLAAQKINWQNEQKKLIKLYQNLR